MDKTNIKGKAGCGGGGIHHRDRGKGMGGFQHDTGMTQAIWTVHDLRLTVPAAMATYK